MKDGKAIKISAMDTDHLRNAMKMLERFAEDARTTMWSFYGMTAIIRDLTKPLNMPAVYGKLLEEYLKRSDRHDQYLY